MNNHPGVVTTIEHLLAEVKGNTISLADVRDTLGERAFGFMLMLALLPSLLPLPGAGTLFGWLVLLMGFQLIIGSHRVLMPGFILNRRFDKHRLEKFLLNHRRKAEYIQRFARPRFSWLITGPAERAAGLFVVLMAVPIILPMPLTNLLPAVAVLLVAVAMVQHDGIVALGAYIVGIISLILLAAVYGGLVFGLWMSLTRTLGLH